MPARKRVSAREKQYRRRRIAIAVGLLAVVVCAILLGGRLWDYVLQRRYPLEYGELVRANAQEHHLEESLIYAVIKTESGFDADAVSRAGAMGLMQLTPDTFDYVQMKTGKTWEDDQILEPEVNIYCGSWLLRFLLDRYDQNLPVALAAYNAGMGNVASWLEDPQYSENGVDLTHIPFPETASYVEKVQEAQKQYEKQYFS
ncbi:MAG: lytic transglycosylase domain-containing protein [Eubacteriales bacterium]|jgi:soluble lytic murein transglycosylase